MKKIVKIGWIAKEVKLFEVLYWRGETNLRRLELDDRNVYKTQSRGSGWYEVEGPPRKIRITIEEIE